MRHNIGFCFIVQYTVYYFATVVSNLSTNNTGLSYVLTSHHIHAGWRGLHLQSSGMQTFGALSARAASIDPGIGLGMALISVVKRPKTKTVAPVKCMMECDIGFRL
ncbi:hypothetical protein DE146DRAFT_651359, partial [Phaeosphaeria sp. MPI-PUGE-AT-0046c]